MTSPLPARFMCPHGGQVNVVPQGARVKAGGQPVFAFGDAVVVAGCPAPNPCVRIVFPTGSARARTNGRALLTAETGGQCFAANGALNGFAVIVETRPRVSAG